MRRLVVAAAVLAVAGLAVFWVLTIPASVDPASLPERSPDLANGETMFWAGGCESCHATGDDALLLGGGEGLVTPFGTFHAPNISPHAEDGIGGWTTAQFVNAMINGVGARGEHLYPAFPYLSYQTMTVEDLIDLKAFLNTLPAVEGDAPDHDLGFPFNVRRGLGLWKLLYARGETFAPDPDRDAAFNRGAYLVNGPGHCGECHTPRNLIGGPDGNRAFAGGPAPEGTGSIPNITPHEDGIGAWSESEIAFMLEAGFTPDFQVIGGAMAAVVRNMGHLTADDRAAMARYLASLAPIANR